MKIVNKIIKNFNLKKFGGPNDRDHDGVPNEKDCQPNNTFRQDFSDTQLLRFGGASRLAFRGVFWEDKAAKKMRGQNVRKR